MSDLAPSLTAEAAIQSYLDGDLPRALALAEAAIDAAPCPEAFSVIAEVREARGESRRAVAAFRRGLTLFPSDPNLAINFARTLRRMPGRAEEAVRLLRDVVERWPAFAPARLSLIETLRTSTDRLDQAESQAREYVRLFPDEPDGHLALALALFNRGDLTAALASADRCMAAHGNALRALELKANIFVALGSPADALASYRDYLARALDADVHSRALSAMHYCDGVTAADIAAETRVWAHHHTAGLVPFDCWPKVAFEADRPLTLGIVSRDFRRCSTLYLARPVFEHLPEQWTVTFYANLEYADGGTALFRGLCDRWVDIGGLDDAQAAGAIMDDGVDVLIDLNGHTLGGRPGMFARKPAPVQLAWLDYVGTTGLATMDGIIADASHLPLDDQVHYDEPILHVADNLYRYAAPDDAPDVGALPAAANGFITFGCFNSAYKLSETTLRLWSAVLRGLPTARLLLNSPEYAHADTRRRFLDRFAAHGIESARIGFVPGAATSTAMLSHYGAVDITLDPTPYSGGLTTLEALYMGVPVVTLAGERFCARHSSAHLRCVGLSDWIAADAASYVRRALAMASDLEALSTVRAGLRTRMRASCLMDGAALAGDMVRLIRALWRGACARNAGSQTSRG